MQGIYDFWSNRRIEPQSILSGHRARTVERCQEHKTVLAALLNKSMNLRWDRHLPKLEVMQ